MVFSHRCEKTRFICDTYPFLLCPLHIFHPYPQSVTDISHLSANGTDRFVKDSKSTRLSVTLTRPRSITHILHLSYTYMKHFRRQRTKRISVKKDPRASRTPKKARHVKGSKGNQWFPMWGPGSIFFMPWPACQPALQPARERIP